MQSLDFVLGLVGGFAAIIAGTLGIVFGDYEDFRFKNTLIRHAYNQVAEQGSDNITGPKSAKNAIIRSVNS